MRDPGLGENLTRALCTSGPTGWLQPDFSLVQSCNRNLSCGVGNARPLEKDVHLRRKHEGLGCRVTWMSRVEKLVAALKNELLY